VPVVTGPHVFNFAQITQMLLEEEAAVQVATEDALAQTVVAWLGDASLRARIGENGRRVVEQNRGALERLAAVIEGMLEGSEAPQARDGAPGE
jgi:3-deoxy-D-manno-octulosonic-acid transferase